MMKFLDSLDPWILVYCQVLLGVAIGFAVKAWLAAAKIVRATGELKSAIDSGDSAPVGERRDGRPRDKIELIELKTAKLSPLATTWWDRLDGALTSYGPDTRNRGWFLSAPAGEILDEDFVIHRHYDGGFYASVPGLLTSMGLLGTFIAILIGLGSLTLEGEVVKGVPGLVGSLSGKFTTSVVALALSAIFSVYEALVVQARMRQARETLLGRVHAVLPRLTTARVLVDLQSESVKQTRALANISADLVDKMAAAFSERVAPTLAAGLSEQMAGRLTQELVPALDRVTSTMGNVGDAVLRLETNKQDSMVGEIRGLTESLKQSLSTSLADMGSQFRDALRSSTNDEFTGLARVLQDSASMLTLMNTSFASMQTALGALIEESRTTTSSQMAEGVARAERINALMEGLLVRLNESASQQATQVQSVLTNAVAGLADRVNALSTEMADKVSQASAQSQAAAAESFRAASDWSARSDKRLADLLDMLQARVADFDKAGAALISAQRVLESTLAKSNEGLQAMQQAASQVRNYSEGLGGLQARLGDAQSAQAQVTVATNQAVESLKLMSQRHEALLSQYDTTLTHAESVMGGLDDRLRRVLDTILEKVQQYNVGVSKNFQEIVRHMNTTMPQMGEVLSGAAMDLRDQVDELTGVIAKATRSIESNSQR
jgi:hypothetical protein